LQIIFNNFSGNPVVEPVETTGLQHLKKDLSGGDY
jgi:hypothetical protein